MTAAVPVLDITEISLNVESPSREAYEAVAKRLDQAWSQNGVCYLVNHGIEQELIERFNRITGDFFKLDPDVKEKYLRNAKDRRGGYVAVGQEFHRENTRNSTATAKTEVRETYNVIRLTNEGIWPNDIIPEFKDVVTNVVKPTRVLAHRFLRALSLCLGQDIEYLSQRHKYILENGDNTSVFRALRYPAIHDNENLENLTRIPVHTDYGTLTFLFQDNVGGLEVLPLNGEWVDATPLDGSIILNTGDLAEIWSGGKYPATVHRVEVPKTEEKRKCERRSATLFIHPDIDTTVEPLIGDQTKYQSINALEHVRKRLAESYQY